MAVTAAGHQRWPGLDGLRGLAVAAVLLFHGGFAWAEGGYLGVSLFFTLSGFLITNLLLVEHRERGGISLGGFWARRARRLLPAAIAGLALALLAVRAATPFAERPTALGDIRAAAVWLANWRFIWQDAAYADIGLTPSPVQHFWSLAIEEQFYLVFPLVALVALRRSRRALAGVLIGVVALSTWRQMAIDDPSRVYFGTDTRAAELALGGLLAIGRPAIMGLVARAPGGRRLADGAGFAGLAATLVLWSAVPDTAGGLYEGGFTAVAVVSTLFVLGAVEGRSIVRVLSWRPLTALGAISYGAYVYHFPIFLVLTESSTWLDTGSLFVLRMAVVLPLAIGSYFLLERPVRLRRRLLGQRATAAFAGGLAVVLLGVAVYDDRLQARFEADPLAAAGLDVLRSEEPEVSSPPTTTAPTVSASTTPSSIATAATVPPTTAPPPPPPARPPHVLVVGDSTAEVIGRGLAAWGTDSGRLRVTALTSSGCATHSGTRLRVREGYEFAPNGCPELFPSAARVAREEAVDAIVVFIGSSQLADWEYPGRSGWLSIPDAGVRQGYDGALRAALATLDEADVPILWADVPTPEWDLEVFGEMLGGPMPGSGDVVMNDPERAAILNGLDRRIIGAHPTAALLPWAEHLAGPDGTISKDVRPDGLHVDEEKVDELAEAWLEDLLDGAYDAVVARAGGSLRPPEAHTWAAPGVSSPG